MPTSRMNNFSVIILSNNRSDNLKTHKVLRSSGYTGKIIIVLDDMDPTVDQYMSNFQDCTIHIFNKKKLHEETDTADNTGNMKAVVFARNACFEIAREYGLDYFLVLDDDYTGFDYRSDNNGFYKYKNIKNLDSVFDKFTGFLEKTPTKCIAFSQGGDFIGGALGAFGKKIELHRKCMNSFFCKTDRPFKFYGLINEDVNMYVLNGSRGELYFTSTLVGLNQAQTQANSGGLTTIYLELGTYVKSFYSVLYHPSSVKVSEMQTTHKRLHHKVNKELTYPKIIEQRWKK